MNKSLKIPLQKPKIEIGSTNSNNNLFALHYIGIIEHPSRQIHLSFRFRNNTCCVFSIENFELHGNQFILTEIVNFNHRKISTRTDITLQRSMKLIRVITTCSAFTLDCGYVNSTINLIGDAFCPNTMCSGKVCLHKKSFQSLSRSSYRCPQCASVCQVLNIPFEDQTNSFFLSFDLGFTFLKRVQDQLKMLLEMSIVLESIVSKEECESLDDYVATPRYIYGFANCGAWLFVHKVPLTLQEHVQTTKTDKTRFFFAEKR